jgi:hypothetical protein
MTKNLDTTASDGRNWHLCLTERVKFRIATGATAPPPPRRRIVIFEGLTDGGDVIGPFFDLYGLMSTLNP